MAQFISIVQGPSYTRDELAAYPRQELEARINGQHALPEQQALLDETPDSLLEYGTLSELFSLAWRLERLANPHEPNWVLAQLPLPFYITTNPTNALFDALGEAEITRRDGSTVKKQPRMEICRWNEDLAFLPSVYDDDPDYRPTPAQLLVYQLFGNLDEPESVVLTEDDYFDFLIGVTSNNELIPNFVRRALVDSALLFLGFGLDERDFRVLYRSVMQRGGRSRRRGYAHVAAQINPEEGRIQEPERARDYLESYFEGDAVSIFWGTADDFIRELQTRL